MLFIARRGPREDRYLEWKIGLFSVAAVIALVGIFLDERWMTGTALVLLVGGMFLRFLPGGGGGGRATYIHDDEEDADDEDVRSGA